MVSHIRGHCDLIVSQLLRPENKSAVPTLTRGSADRIAKDAEVLAIVELDLGFPRGSRDDATTDSR